MGNFKTKLGTGKVDFVVVEAKRKVSKSGNEMTEVMIKVTQDDVEETIWHYILDRFPERMRELLDCLGLFDLTELLIIRNPELLNGKKGTCKIKVAMDDYFGVERPKVTKWLSAPVPKHEGKEVKMEEVIDFDDELPF